MDSHPCGKIRKGAGKVKALPEGNRERDTPPLIKRGGFPLSRRSYSNHRRHERALPHLPFPRWPRARLREMDPPYRSPLPLRTMHSTPFH
jgi:hypothetical protein